MTIKDILAIVMDAAEDEAAIAAAEALRAKSNGQLADAHLACAFLTPLPDEPLAYEPTVVAGVWAELLGRARAESEAARAAVEKRLGEGVELRTAEALSRDLGRVAAVHARYADLVILTRPKETGGELAEELIEGVLFHSGRPALIVPPDWKGGAPGTRVALAWDASREATRALSDAAGLMGATQTVAVITVDAKPRMFGHGDQPGQNVAAHLARRGHDVEVRNADSMGRPIAQTIIEEAQAFGADLLVLGAYGHSRLRERVFGGATRDLMRTCPIPMLMAH
jgi:nucleotide-binding universal stress UspA family protein